MLVKIHYENKPYNRHYEVKETALQPKESQFEIFKESGVIRIDLEVHNVTQITIEE